MILYALQEYRTDTTKHGSESILKLYQHEPAAQTEAHKRNLTESKDEYSVMRYRVVKMEVDTSNPFTSE